MEKLNRTQLRAKTKEQLVSSYLALQKRFSDEQNAPKTDESALEKVAELETMVYKYQSYCESLESCLQRIELNVAELRDDMPTGAGLRPRDRHKRLTDGYYSVEQLSKWFNSMKHVSDWEENENMAGYSMPIHATNALLMAETTEPKRDRPHTTGSLFTEIARMHEALTNLQHCSTFTLSTVNGFIRQHFGLSNTIGAGNWHHLLSNLLDELVPKGSRGGSLMDAYGLCDLVAEEFTTFTLFMNAIAMVDQFSMVLSLDCVLTKAEAMVPSYLWEHLLDIMLDDNPRQKLEDAPIDLDTIWYNRCRQNKSTRYRERKQAEAEKNRLLLEEAKGHWKPWGATTAEEQEAYVLHTHSIVKKHGVSRRLCRQRLSRHRCPVCGGKFHKYSLCPKVNGEEVHKKK